MAIKRAVLCSDIDITFCFRVLQLKLTVLYQEWTTAYEQAAALKELVDAKVIQDRAESKD